MNAPDSRRYRWLGAAGCALAGVVLWHGFGNAVRGYIDTGSVFCWWAVQWFTPGAETEHGPVLLLLAGWVFWRNLRRAQPLEWPEPARRRSIPPADQIALTAMAFAIALHALGYTVQQTRLSILALLIFTWGVLCWGGGWRWGRAAVFPLALLLFAIPVEFLDAAGFHLRLGVIRSTESLVHLMGIEVVRNGTQLFDPGRSYSYDVAAACSGVRSLLALLALSLLIGYLQLRSWWARALVFALAFPLTYLGNVLRILSIVLAGEWFGQRAGEWVHAGAGWLVFVVVLGGVQAATGLLARRERRQAPAPAPASASCGSARRSEPAPARALVWIGPLAVVSLCFATAVLVRQVDDWAVRAEAGVRTTAGGEPAPLPGFIATDWIGQFAPVTEVEREVLPPDTGYSRRNYVSTHDRRRQVFLSVVLSGQDRTSIHRPELCVVGQGWSIVGRDKAQLVHPQGGHVPVATLRLAREWPTRRGERQQVEALLVYWFVGRDAVTASTWERMGRTALNRLRLKPDRWAYVVAQTLLLPGETEAAARDRVQEVLTGTLPAIQPAQGADGKPAAVAR